MRVKTYPHQPKWSSHRVNLLLLIYTPPPHATTQNTSPPPPLHRPCSVGGGSLSSQILNEITNCELRSLVNSIQLAEFYDKNRNIVITRDHFEDILEEQSRFYLVFISHAWRVNVIKLWSKSYNIRLYYS